MQQPTYYQILEVEPHASAAAIRQAYRRLVLLTHPDRTPDPAAHARYLAVNEAYETIGNVQRRQQYDARLAAAARPTAASRHTRRPVAHKQPAAARPVRTTPASDYQRYARNARRWCRWLLLLPCLMLVDYGWPTQFRAVPTRQIVATHGLQPTWAVDTPAGAFQTYGTVDYTTATVEVRASPLGHFVHAARLPSGANLPLLFQPTVLLSFMVLLGMLAAVGQWHRLSATSQVNIAIGATMVAIITGLLWWHQ